MEERVSRAQSGYEMGPAPCSRPIQKRGREFCCGSSDSLIRKSHLLFSNLRRYLYELYLFCAILQRHLEINSLTRG